MAKNTAETAIGLNPTTSNQDPFAAAFGGEAPAGMRDLGAPEIQGWFSPEPGLVFCGQILSSFMTRDVKKNTERDVLIIRLAKPTKAKDADDTERSVLLGEGAILGVSVTHKLQDLLSYVEHQGWVWVKALRKKDIGGGQQMWLYDVRVKGTRAAPRRGTVEESGEQSVPALAAADDCPF